MRARLVFLLIGVLSAVRAFGAYYYDYAQTVGFYGAIYEIGSENGDLGSGINNYASFAGTGGSMIWTGTISGTNSNDYEINTPLTTANGGGTFIHFVRASLDADAFSGSCAGSYISAELAVTGTTHTGPVAPATLNINQCVSGSLSHLGSTAVSFPDGATMRTVVWGTTLWVYLNDQQAWAGTIPSTTGHPGLGGYNVNMGNFLSVNIGHHDTVAPNALTSTSVHSSILPTSVSLAWDGVSDDVNGIGVYGYCVASGSTTTPCSGLASSTLIPAGGTFTDATVSAGTAYTYSIAALDFHGNAGTAASVNVTTPPANAVDPRRVGTFTTGSYWGGGGEQIDTLSGNLNFSFPLVTPQGRSGWSVPIGLSYNSQNWRQDSGTNWNLGIDVGYGYGWKLQIGSITPYYNLGWTSGVNHYTFTDSTGAEYRLDQKSGTVWSSTQGIYVWFDSATNILHFNNGTFWVMGSVSGGNEQDAGTMYPTVIEDVNGNQVLVWYAGSPSLAGSMNTSARIAGIEDVRAVDSGWSWMFYSQVGPYLTYEFTYANLHSGDPFPHLSYITNWIGTAESHGFLYTSVSTEPPFGTDPSYSGQTTNELTRVSMPGAGISYSSLTYDTAGAGELTQVTFPWGGHLRWSYLTATYAGSRLLREVQNRYLAADSAGATEWTYPFTHSDTGVSGGIATVHVDTTLADASGTGAKKWTFDNSSSAAWQMGLVAEFDQLTSATGSKMTTDTYTWSQTPTSLDPYISMKVSAKDPGTSYVASAETTQTLDQYGNVTQAVVYPYNNTTTPVATYNNSYLGGTYIGNYIRNRLSQSTVTVSAGTKTLVTNYYDTATLPSSNPCTSYSAWGTSGAGEYDAAPPVPVTQRGRLILTANPATSTCMQYDSFGSVAKSENSNGSTATATPAPDTNYVAPDGISTQSYSDSLSYNAWLGITQTTGANGEAMYMTYDSDGRPATAASPYSPYGTPTEAYSYSDYSPLPFQQMKTGSDGFTRTTLDGIGRPILVERGTSSRVDTVYAPCACSPLGKIQKTSQPYAPGATEYWTTYTYDGIGRTLALQQPDGASATTYSYTGAVTKVTDPAGKWKQFTSDVQGNLLEVDEPDPSLGTVSTYYTYDWMNHLSASTMTRSGTTQTRTFAYNDAGELTSATNPENGTVSYTYNADTTLATKTDAKGQEAVYSYDSTSKKLTEVQWYPLGAGHAEDVCQRVTYTYGTSSSSYNYGRLLTTAYGSWSGPYYDPNGWVGTCVPGSNPTTYTESYTYHPAGGVTGKTLTVTRRVVDMDGGVNTDNASVSVAYAYNSVGNVATTTYPQADAYHGGDHAAYYGGFYFAPVPVTFTYGYDSMGRPVSLTDDRGTNEYLAGSPDPANDTVWVQGVTYDAGNRMTGLQRYLSSTAPDCSDWMDNNITESRGYNASGQMTSKSFSSYAVNCHVPTSLSGGFTYTYSPTANNGQITQVNDAMSAETIVYTYDSLKRLTQAASTPNAGSTPTAWTQQFQYDGFGNLTAKVLNGTTSSIGVTAGTNRLSGSSYDLNGNMLTGMGATLTYDEADRVASATPISGGTEYYGYGPDNRRVYRLTATGGEAFTFYGGHGEKLGDYSFDDSDGYGRCREGCYLWPGASNVWFGGMLVWDGGGGASGAPNQDQVGTNRVSGARFYPYGDEITSPSNDRVFATYERGSLTGLDYASARYYASAYGRFTSVDSGAVSTKDPVSWNRYTYTGGDPINRGDPSGNCWYNSDGEDPMEDWDWNYGQEWTDPGWVKLPGGCFQGPEYESALGWCAPGGGVLAYTGGGYECDAAAAVETPAPTPKCEGADGLTANQTVAVETVMGENSNYLIGKSPYPNAPTVTAAAVYQEDMDMFSVLTNRAQSTGSTIGGVILAHPGQFSGYTSGLNGGITQFNNALNSLQGSAPCNDLTAIVDAMDYVVQNGSQLPSNYLFWHAISQGGGIFHVQQPGDIYVANTAFGSLNTN